MAALFRLAVPIVGGGEGEGVNVKGGMSRSMCPSESLIFGPRNQCLLTTSC